MSRAEITIGFDGVKTATETLITRCETWLELRRRFKVGNRCRFFDGENTFAATIEDQDFLQKVKNGDISFSAADKLLVELEEEQEVGAEIRKLASRVVRVIKHVPGPRQMRFL